MEDWLVVQRQSKIFTKAFVAEFAHTKVAHNLVTARDKFQIVQKWLVWRPTFEVGRHLHYNFAFAIRLGNLHFAIKHHASDTFVGGANRQNLHLGVVVVGDDFYALDVLFGDTFHPNGLPNATLRGVPHAFAVGGLLAVGVVGCVGKILRANN